MIPELIALLAGLLIGIWIGQARVEDKDAQRLRKRGYTIHCRNKSPFNYYWCYNGYNEKAQYVKMEGPNLPTRVDAVANADAHYHATILSKPMEFTV